MRGVHAVYTNPSESLESRLLGLLLIERFALLMVILFISLELSPGSVYTNVWPSGAAVFGQRITLMQGELGGGEGGAVGNWAPGAAWGGPPGKREQASPGLDL